MLLTGRPGLSMDVTEHIPRSMKRPWQALLCMFSFLCSWHAHMHDVSYVLYYCRARKLSVQLLSFVSGFVAVILVC